MLKGIVYSIISVFAIASAYAQRQQYPKYQTAASIFIKNSKKIAQSGVQIVLEGTKDNKKYKFKTNDKGLAEAVIPRGQNYVLNLKDAPGFDTVVAQYNSSQIFNFYIEYDKNGDTHPKLNPLKEMNLMPTEDQILLEVSSPQFVGDSVELINYSTGGIKWLKVDSRGSNKILVKKGETFGIRWRGFSIEDSIGFRKSRAIQTIEVRLNKAYAKRYNGPVTKERKEYALKMFVDVFAPYPDSLRNKNIIEKVFQRQKWSDVLLVADVTGSMQPYINDVSNWFNEFTKTKNKVQFTFFNDGDNLPDEKKVVGNIGGIYYCNGESKEEIHNTLVKCMTAGNGGDAPENNLEAIIKGSQQSKPYKDLVLVADNYSGVKDMALLNKVTKPVHIILCGFEYFVVHEDYLNIAYKTKGSLHTLTEDVIDFSKGFTGSEIKLGNAVFKLEGDQFVRMK